MLKPLSAQLTDLSVRAKKAEEALAAAQKEAQEELVARREKARAAATNAIQKIERHVQAANDKVVENWNALKVKVAADMDAWKSKIAKVKHKQDVRDAETYADMMEWQAAFAIDCAMAAIEEAEAIVLDSTIARIEAEKAKAA
jgi:hypothetical protein